MSSVMTEILFKGTDIAVYADNLSMPDDLLVITFTPRLLKRRDLNSDLKSLAFGASFFPKRKIATINFIAAWNHWWQTDEFELAIKKALDFIKRNRYSKIWSYSSSMGATGAIMSASRLGVDGVLAISPQFSVDPKIIGFDNRWVDDQSQIKFTSPLPPLPEKPIKTYIIYDNLFHLDARHAEMVIGYNNGIPIHIPHSLHAPAQILQDCGMLSELVMSIFSGEFSLPVFYRQFDSNKEKSPLYLHNTSMHAKKNGNIPRAFEIAQECMETLNSMPNGSQPPVISKMIRDNYESLVKLTAKSIQPTSLYHKKRDTLMGHVEDIIYESENLIIKNNDIPTSEKIVITFTPRLGNVDVQNTPGFGERFFEKSGIAAIHIIPKWNHWWQVPDFFEQLKILAEHPAIKSKKEVWTYGASMGGTAAFMAAHPLSATGIISICPQSTVDLNKAKFDPRWLDDRKKITSLCDDWTLPTAKTKAYLIYDNKFNLDATHADLLSNKIELERISIPFSEHATTGMLRECNMLSSLIKNLLSTNFNSTEFKYDLRKNRKNSIAAFSGASAALLKAKKIKAALFLASRAIDVAERRLKNGNHIDHSLVQRAVTQKMTCLISNKKHGDIFEFIEKWKPFCGNAVDFTPYQLQAGLFIKNADITFPALMSMWSRSGQSPSAGLCGSAISAIRSCLTEQQILQFHTRWGDLIESTSYSEQYKNALTEYKNVKFTDKTRNVIAGKNGYLFLSGGYHSILDYITGRRVPSSSSLVNFKENIKSRNKFCSARNIQYKHVIFPDKQSIQLNDFPLDNILCLGDQYLAKDPELQDLVIYPKDHLQQAGNAFLKVDTHISDHGYVALTIKLLQELRIDKIKHEQIYSELLQCLTKTVKYSGDLGSKISPQQFDIRQDIEADWKHYHTKNNLGVSNDGVAELYFNPDAPTNLRVLIFGDSFFRRQSLLLSKIFKEVGFFRSRYFHEDIVEMSSPDIVLTGNAERYLSSVDSDDNSPSFFLYPQLKGIDQEANIEYATAMNAFLSFGRPAYSKFYETMFPNVVDN